MTRTIDPRRIEVIDGPTAKMFRALSGTRRIQIGFELNRSAWRIVEASVRARYPAWTGDAVQREVARRFLSARPG